MPWPGNRAGSIAVTGRKEPTFVAANDAPEIAARLQAYQAPDRAPANVALRKYAKLVSSAAEGAVTR